MVARGVLVVIIPVAAVIWPSLCFPTGAVGRGAGPEELEYQTVVDGFAWAENMACVTDADGQASLYVTENRRGELWRVYDTSSTTYDKILHPMSSNFSLLAGLASDPETGRLYALGNPSSGDGNCVLVSVRLSNTSDAPAFEVLAKLPRACLGDGLARHQPSGLFYVASEGNFIPGMGKVYEVSEAGEVRELVSRSFSNDGAFMDQSAGLLYVTLVADPRHTMLVLNVSGDDPVGRLTPSVGMSTLDDLTLSDQGSKIIAASFLKGELVRFDAWQGQDASPDVETLASGLISPTSARFGCSKDAKSGLHESVLFVTEGGGMLGSTTDRRVLSVRGVGEHSSWVSGRERQWW